MIMNKKVHCQICFGFGQSRDAVMPKGNTIGKFRVSLKGGLGLGLREC